MEINKAELEHNLKQHFKHVPYKGSHTFHITLNDVIIYIQFSVDADEKKIPDSDSFGEDMFIGIITKVKLERITLNGIRAEGHTLIEECFDEQANEIIGKKYDW